MSGTEITAPTGSHEITVTHEFAATPEQLFRAYTDPELLIRWLGPQRLTMRVERWDPRAGGRWRYVHVDPDGSEYTFHGVFHGEPSVAAGIVQTFEYAGAPGHVALDAVSFEPRGDRTVVHTRSVHQTVEARDAHIAAGMADGVRQSMDRLTELLAAVRPVRTV